MKASETAGVAWDAAGTPADSVFAAVGGEMAALMRQTEWGALPIGSIEGWPQSLTTILRMLVTSRYAMWMAWGSDLTMFYNDAYAPTLGVKHPWALGRPAHEVWSEIWADIGPRIQRVMQTGTATWDEALMLFPERSGYAEETYHTFSYSPLPADDGSVGGMLCVVTDDTMRVLSERRLATLRELGSRLAAVRTEAEVVAAVEQSLGQNPRDLPFSVAYLQEPDRGHLRCVARTGGIGEAHAPAILERLDDLAWPSDDVLSGRVPRLVHDLRGEIDLPRGAWDRPPRQVVMVPIAVQGRETSAGLYIAGLNPYRPVSDLYMGFIDLVAAQIGSGLTSAGAYEAERRRAAALAEIDRAKMSFFSNISHEFRTPLTLMIGPLEEELAALSGQPDRQDGVTRLAMVHLNSLRVLRLVNALLDFSRIEAGRIDGSFQPIDFSRLTADLASTFRSACKRAGMFLEVNCPALSQPVYLDPEMWERVVLNLLSNAFKFTLSGGITIATAEKAGGAVLIVRDTGVGIPASELPRLFDRFHRIRGQRGRTLEGTGIGLALVNELVHLHGGEIKVESAVDVGTTLTVWIPFGRAHLPQSNVSDVGEPIEPGLASTAFVHEALRWLPNQEGESQGLAGEFWPANDIGSPTLAAAAGARRCILLADDNADMRDYVTRLLRDAGYGVMSVRDGVEALAAARNAAPDLILSDVMMPRMDGFGLLSAVRSDAAIGDIPIILLSARAGEEARVEGLDGGAADYLMKPFSARELLARVRSNLELARLRSQAREALRRANEQLEERVAEEVARRNAAEEAQRQSQRMEAIGHLTGGVAHDFNNLLTIIGGGVETLQRTLASIPLGDYETRVNRSVAMIVRGAERAATLTYRLLAFARRQALHPRPLDANRLVSGVSELLRRTLGEAIVFELDLADGLWQTMADANQLENALVNLAVNARDAMPEGGQLSIQTANVTLDEVYAAGNRDLDPGEYVMIAVADTGCGMDKTTLSQVFEPFFTTKDIGHGTGLGLSQVYGFMKQSRGHIQILSTLSEGTEVRLYLPRLVGADGQPEALESILEPPSPLGRGEVILVVEDEEAVREHSVQSLRELGYRVQSAENGKDALRLLAEDPSIVLLFTDIGLPGGMTGRQLADVAVTQRPALKVLYTTGYARNAIVYGKLDGSAPLLPKPFSFSALATKIRAVLDGDGSAPS